MRQSNSFCRSLSLVLLLVLASCSSTKYVEEGQLLLRSVDIRLDSTAKRDGLREIDLLPYLSQKPNTKVFGAFHWGLGIYNLSQPASDSWFSRRMRAWGEAPVLYNEQDAEQGRMSLSSALYNMGYLDADVKHRVDTLAKRKARSIYELQLGQRYSIAQHRQYVANPVLMSLLNPQDSLLQKRDYPTERYSSLLDSGAWLSPNLMQAERKRISQILRNRGHWAFREDYIHFDVDTTGGYHSAWIDTHIDSTSQVYRIGRVQLQHIPSRAHDGVYEEHRVGGVSYMMPKGYRLKPKFLDSRISIRPQDLYSQDKTSRTYAALSDIPLIRSANIHYSVDSSQRVPTLNVDIQTQAERSKELSADLVGTHSGGNLGAIASLAFGHNNFLSGAEQLRLAANLGYEDLGSGSRDHITYGLEATIRFPKLMVPFFRNNKQRSIKGATDLSLSYSYLTRPEFNRNLLSSSWGYSWTHYRYPALRYQFKLLEVDYMHFGYMDASFLSTVPDYDRMLNYRNQLVVSSSFMLSYNSLADPRKVSHPMQHNIRFYVQTAGSLLMAYSRLTGAERDARGIYTFAGANILQFLRAELDYSGLYRLGGKNALAYHAALSGVLPYGNSNFLPIDLRYFSGGASSLRGWSARTLGPGSMSRSVGTSIYHQVGDIKLDLSAELRLRFAPSWELALFADAGNIWTARKYSEQVGGNFALDRFYKEIALSSGLGLRWDFDYFLLRLDAGLKLYDPQQAEGERWVFGRQSLGKLLGVHIALGYPF